MEKSRNNQVWGLRGFVCPFLAIGHPLRTVNSIPSVHLLIDISLVGWEMTFRKIGMSQEPPKTTILDSGTTELLKLNEEEYKRSSIFPRFRTLNIRMFERRRVPKKPPSSVSSILENIGYGIINLLTDMKWTFGIFNSTTGIPTPTFLAYTPPQPFRLTLKPHHHPPTFSDYTWIGFESVCVPYLPSAWESCESGAKPTHIRCESVRPTRSRCDFDANLGRIWFESATNLART